LSVFSKRQSAARLKSNETARIKLRGIAGNRHERARASHGANGLPRQEGASRRDDDRGGLFHAIDRRRGFCLPEKVNVYKELHYVT
jgi:hypothetical protein